MNFFKKLLEMTPEEKAWWVKLNNFLIIAFLLTWALDIGVTIGGNAISLKLLNQSFEGNQTAKSIIDSFGLLWLFVFSIALTSLMFLTTFIFKARFPRLVYFALIVFITGHLYGFWSWFSFGIR